MLVVGTLVIILKYFLIYRYRYCTVSIKLSDVVLL
jgi:hypothetical protein